MIAVKALAIGLALVVSSFALNLIDGAVFNRGVLIAGDLNAGPAVGHEVDSDQTMAQSTQAMRNHEVVIKSLPKTGLTDLLTMTNSFYAVAALYFWVLTRVKNQEIRYAYLVVLPSLIFFFSSALPWSFAIFFLVLPVIVFRCRQYALEPIVGAQS